MRMNRGWLANYPAGVPAEVEVGTCGSLVDLLEGSFSRFRERTAFVCMKTRMTYDELDASSLNLAAYLQGIGLRVGDRVAIMLPNLLQYPIAMAAVLRAGGVVVNVNPMYTARELEHQLADSGATVIVVLENFASTLETVLPSTAIQHVVVTSVGERLGSLKGAVVDFAVRQVRRAVPAFQLPAAVRFNAALRIGAKRKFEKPTLGGDDVAALQYTGGTTGVSKGAVLLHSTLLSSVFANESWMAPGLRRRSGDEPLNIVCALPLYHVFAFVVCALLGMRAGGVNLLIPDPRDVGGMIRALAPYRLHVFPGVNTLFNAIVQHPEVHRLDFSELCIANGGGAAVLEGVATAWAALTGRPIIEGYGLTETASAVTCNPTDATRHNGTIGLPMPGVDLRILSDDGRDIGTGVPGEIAVRGPQVMRGYWLRPDDTAQAFTSDGYFKTGDVGVMDDEGYVRVVDRKKDMILVSGFNVYPNEIEGLVSTHPGVRECAAIGVSDPRSGEAVMLFVVRRNASLAEEELLAFCAAGLAAYKRPRHVRFCEDLPKSNVGKVLRRELRKVAA